MTTTTAPVTRPETQARGRDLRLVVILTAISIAFAVVMELLVVMLQPSRQADLVRNISSVGLWSLIGLALTCGLVLLGRRAEARAPVAWTLAVLGLAASGGFYFLALPTSLSAGAYVLARAGAGSLRAARILAIVGIAASFVVSAAMMYTYL